MPPRDIRILFWDEKLRTKRRFTLVALMDAFLRAFNETLSERAFRDDVKALREKGAPLKIVKFDMKNPLLEANAKAHYFYEADFSLAQKQPLTAEDVERIRQATTLLKQFEHLPQFQDLEALLFKLEHEAGIKGIVSKEEKDIIAFEQVPKLKGLDRLKMLYNAIRNKHVLSLYYKEFSSKDLNAESSKQFSYYNESKKGGFQTLLHPYFLKEFNNRWYIYGLDQNTQAIRPYALDRIEQVKIDSFPYLPNRTENFDTYFDNRIGISSFRNTPTEKVIIRVFQPRAQYVVTKPWHPSQAVVADTRQYLDFQFHLIINQELEAQVLEFGQDIEVLEPLSFREQILLILHTALSRY
jgi:predicted DNA-binding transcriptional regulator YafY